MADQRRDSKHSQHSSARSSKHRKRVAKGQPRSLPSERRPQAPQESHSDFFSPKYPSPSVPQDSYSYAGTEATPTPSGRSSTASVPKPDDKPQAMSSSGRKRSGLFGSWVFWTTFAIAVLGGVSGFSFALLYKIPALPNCPSIFWPTASASLRMYCADLAANKKTVDDLLSAISLVDGLPSDHPMRGEADTLIDGWSLEILNLAEGEFHQGELERAIEMAERIPTQGSAYEQVDQRIDSWRATWAQAEEVYDEAKSAIQSDNLRLAFSTAVKLLDVDNEYWATVKYKQINELIESSREVSDKLAEARSLSRRGGVENLLAAIDKVETVEDDSLLYPAARRLLVELWDDVLQAGQAALDRGEVDNVTRIADRLPPGLEYQAQASDLRELAIAVRRAQSGTRSGLEAAIIQAEGLPASRPLYNKAQQLVRGWQQEIQGVQRIETARSLAAPGTIAALREAVAEVRLVPNNNPRHGEAQELADGWLREIYTIEDRPLLERAEQLASEGDVFSLQAAILEARRIGENRPLHGEAQRQIQSWTLQVERIQDRPYLNEANQIARTGNLQRAIAVAEQIQPDRALYDEAQRNIRQWQRQIEQTALVQQSQAQLQQATRSATVGTPSALSAAIRTANQVGRNTPQRAEADRLINQWSETLLRMAQSEARQDLERAIAVAELIPPQTTAFAPAQLQLREWRSRLSPRQDMQPVNPGPIESES